MSPARTKRPKSGLDVFLELDRALSDLTYQQLKVLALVEEHERRTGQPMLQSDIVRPGLTKSTVSACLAILGNIGIDTHSQKIAPYGLLRVYEDPMNRRSNVVSLTPKGRQFFS